MTDRIAFIAVRSISGLPKGPKQSFSFEDLEAVVIGTADDEGKDWRYACYKLKDLNDILGSRELGSPFSPAGGKEKVVRYRNGRGGDEKPPYEQPFDDFDPTGSGDIVLDNVLVCTAYRAPTASSATADGIRAVFNEGPLALFDTVGFALDTGNAPAGKWLVSRVVVTPALSQSGRLAAFRIQPQIRLALNGHGFDRDSDRQAGDRFDTRIILSMTAAQTQAPRSLWKTPSANGEPRGAQCDAIDCYLTIRPWVSLAQAARSLTRLGFTDADLIDAAIGKHGGDSTHVDVSPLLTDLGVAPPSTPPSREFGLRVVMGGASNYDVQRVALRFELELSNHADKLGPNFTKFIPDFINLPLNGTVGFAQEQRRGDIGRNPGKAPDISPTGTAWIVTARLKPSSADGITSFVAKTYNACVINEQRALRQVRDGGPLSVLPQLSVTSSVAKALKPSTDSWHIVSLLREATPWRRIIHPASDRAEDGSKAGRFFKKLTFEPRFIADMWQGRVAKDGDLQFVSRADASFHRLVASDGTPSQCSVQLTAPKVFLAGATTDSSCVTSPAWQPAVTMADAAAVPQANVRFAMAVETTDKSDIILGAFGFSLMDPPGAGGQTVLDLAGMISFWPANTTKARPDQLTVELDGLVKLPVQNIVPAGQDDLLPDVRQQLYGPPSDEEADPDEPLVFALEGREAQPVADDQRIFQTIAATESFRRGRDQSVALSLHATSINASGTPPRGLALVIDPMPFRVAAAEYLQPAAAAGDQGSEVAVWNGGAAEGLSWRIRDDAQSVRLILPPQVIGEAMEKFSSAVAGVPLDIQPDKPAAARFASATRLEIDPTYFPTAFREPGWNLRRVLGYPNMRSPGSRLRDLRLELLYGMTARVTVPDDKEGAFITEMSGAIGAPVLPAIALSDQPALLNHLALAKAVLTTQRRRLAVDKLWSGNPDAELKIEDSVAFHLRTLVKGQPNNGPATKLRWPVVGEVPTDTGGLIDAAALSQTFTTSQDDGEAFPGGAAWAFESPNILTKVYSRPDADSGWLKDVYLSAHGGYGGQRALFDEKKTVIETQTTQGRTHRYKLERIGRIGALWNRAKHVIVYERSVVPSAQFYNKDPIGKLQDEHAGRPILRKVEEYVEILQPARRFPEDGTSIASAGFLVGCEFKSTKIRVDGRWGGDVRREGWQVPLWNKTFAQFHPATGDTTSSSDPDDPSLIYPKPQISMLMAGEGGGEISAELDEPEKLVFYTSVVTGESGDNTDLWRAVRDIDFVDLPPPVVGKLSPRSEYLTDATLPPEPPHAPGYERLTVGLVPAKEAAVLTHGRSQTGPGAVLKNVTLARSTPSSSSGGEPVRALGQMLTQGSADLRAMMDAKVGEALGVLEKLDPTSSKADIKNAIQGALKQKSFTAGIKGATDDLGNQLKRLSTGGAITLPNKPAETLLGRVDQAVQGQVQRLRAVADTAIDTALATTLAPVNAVAGMARDALTTLIGDGVLTQDVRAGLIEDLNALQNRLATIADEAKADIELLPGRVSRDLEAIKAVAGITVGAGQDQALTAIVTAINEAFDKLKTVAQDAKTVDRPIKEAADGVSSLLDQAPITIDDILAKIDDASALSAARRLLPYLWSVTGATKAYVSNLTFGATIDAAKLKDNAEKVHTLQLQLSARLGVGSPAVQALVDLFDEFIKHAQDFAGEIVTAVENAIDEGLDQANSLLNRISDLIYALADIQDPTDPDGGDGGDGNLATKLSDALQAVIDRVGLLETALGGIVQQITAALHTVMDQWAAEITEATRQLVGSLVSSCQAFDGFITDAVNQADQYAQWLANSLDPDAYATRLQKEVGDAIDNATGTLEEIKRVAADKAAEISGQVENRARQIAGTVQETVRDTLGTDPVELADQANRVYQQGSDTLRVLRALGDPPKTDRLGFNRPEVAYVLAETNKIVDMTPAIAFVNRVSDTIAAGEKAGQAVGDMLQSFGVRLPGSAVAEQFVSDKLKSLSVADLIPNMGGIDFRGLLKRFAFPDLDDNKAIKVRHGFDQVQMRAWLESEIDVPFTEPAPLLSFGPVEIIIDGARFNAKAKLSAGQDGTRKTMNGYIAGDWRVVAAGQDILTFRQTGLFFDDSGHLDFRIDPERVELADALEFITNFLAASGQGDGLVIEPLMRGAMPAGVAARMDLALPDLQLGVFGISNLSLHILFGVAAIPEFELLCDLSVGKKTLPFTLSVWILNGGGFLTQRLSFRPIAKPKPVLVYSLEVGIVAGVGLGFNFGVLSGGVWLQVGCSITMTWSTGPGGNTTALSVFILARGNVDVAGLVTACISLLLEVTYDGSLMIGSGTLRLSFKISMFYTLRVSQHVEYVFAGHKSSDANYSDSYA